MKNFFPKFAKEAIDYLLTVSSLVISFLIAGIIGASRNAILNSAGVILLVVILHNVLGYVLGFAIGKATGMNWRQMVALSIEVGMQNSGLATAWPKPISFPCPWLAYRCHLQCLAQHLRCGAGLCV